MLLKRNDEEVIIQYGVKGMKWGVSRGSSTSSSRSGKKKRSSSKKSSTSKKKASSSSSKTKTKSVKDMSDDDIRNALNRIDLEKRYIAATTPAKRSATQKIVSNIMSKSAENIGTQIATYAMGTMVNNMMKQKFPDGIVNPKKGQKDK